MSVDTIRLTENMAFFKCFPACF